MFALFEIVKTRFYVVTILSKLNYILEMQWEFFFNFNCKAVVLHTLLTGCDSFKE